tara:strand:+ start:523 stop:1191 length:669 start_codon:yes stop_codon:yes gene_type:complete
MNNKIKKALVLLSGGLDSTVVLSICKNLNLSVYAVSFDYGQRHKIELEFAKWQAKRFECFSHKVFKIDSIGGSALTDDFDVPVNKNVEEIPKEIPITYVPGRNLIFLSFATGYAESLNIDEIYIGVNSVDYSGYPDCRKEFIDRFENLVNISTKKGLEGKKFKIMTPLINLSKKEIILIGKKNNVDFSKTFSCYNPSKSIMCGICDACLLRKKGFGDAGLVE